MMTKIGGPFAAKASPPLGAVIYLRVSTTRQKTGDVSLPSQRKGCVQFSEQLGKPVVDAMSGTDDARPAFQRMIELAKQPDRQFDSIIVYSLSRFYRAGPEMEILIRALSKKGVKVLSVTQPIGDDPGQGMLRQMIGIYDEYSSRENAKNVRRAMIENA